MPEYTWICLNKLDSEYASGPKYAKYAKILNMVGFWIYEHYTVFWICQKMPWQSSEYILGSKYARILNMAGFWIWKLHRALNMPQYLNRMWICLNVSELTIINRVLNMCHTIHSAASLFKLIITYWEIDLFRTRSKNQDGALWKTIIVFNYFLQKDSILNFWEGSKYVSGFKFVLSFEYS